VTSAAEPDLGSVLARPLGRLVAGGIPTLTERYRIEA